jgi:hypothetical protein
VAVWLGNVTPFTFDDPARFGVAQGPPDLTSAEYATDYNEVKALGALVNSTRTAEQTDMAHFFAESSNTYWNRALRTITDTYLSDIGDSARLFALVNIVRETTTATQTRRATSRGSRSSLHPTILTTRPERTMRRAR